MQQNHKFVHVGHSRAHFKEMIRSQWSRNPLSSPGWLPSGLASRSDNGLAFPCIDLFDACKKCLYIKWKFWGMAGFVLRLAHCFFHWLRHFAWDFSVLKRRVERRKKQTSKHKMLPLSGEEQGEPEITGKAVNDRFSSCYSVTWLQCEVAPGLRPCSCVTLYDEPLLSYT